MGNKSCTVSFSICILADSPESMGYAPQLSTESNCNFSWAAKPMVAQRKNVMKSIPTGSSYEGSRQYPDYNYYGNVSLLKAIPQYGFVIGRPSLCVCCGRPYRSGYLKCSCEDVVVCKDCGQTVNKSNARVHRRRISLQCLSAYLSGMRCGYKWYNVPGLRPPRTNGRNLSKLLRSFLGTVCAACSVRNVCRIIGNQLCQRAAVSVQAGGAA